MISFSRASLCQGCKKGFALDRVWISNFYLSWIMTKHFSDISLEILTILKRLTLLKRRLAGKKCPSPLLSRSRHISFSPQSATHNLPFARQWNDHSSTLLLFKSAFNLRNMRVIVCSRAFPMRSTRSRFSGSHFSRMVFRAMKRFLVRDGNKTNASAWEMKLVIVCFWVSTFCGISASLSRHRRQLALSLA